MKLTKQEVETVLDLKRACELAILESIGKPVLFSFCYQKENDYDIIKPEVIADIVCRELDINYEDVFTKTRISTIVEARQIAMYLCRKHAQMSLKEIGRFFGGRDHSTVFHSITVVSGYCDVDMDYRMKLARIEMAVTTTQVDCAQDLTK